MHNEDVKWGTKGTNLTRLALGPGLACQTGAQNRLHYKCIQYDLQTVKTDRRDNQWTDSIQKCNDETERKQSDAMDHRGRVKQCMIIHTMLWHGEIDKRRQCVTDSVAVKKQSISTRTGTEKRKVRGQMQCKPIYGTNGTKLRQRMHTSHTEICKSFYSDTQN